MTYEELEPGPGSRAGTEEKPTAIDEGRVLLRIPRNEGAERLQVALREYQGKQFIDLRLWWRADDGRYLPSKKGVSVRLRELQDVARVLGDPELRRVGGIRTGGQGAPRGEMSDPAMERDP